MMKRMALVMVCVLVLVALTGCVARSRYNQLLAANGVQKDKVDELGRQVDQARLTATGLKAQLKGEQEAVDVSRRSLSGTDSEIAVLRKRADDLQAQLDAQLKTLDKEPPRLPGGGRAPRVQAAAVKPVDLPSGIVKSLEDLAAEERGFEFDRTSGRCTFSGEVLFEPGDDVVTPAFERTLKKFAAIFTGTGRDLFLRIEGHTDNEVIRNAGSKTRHPTNWHLSAHRAIEVMRVLFKAGLEEERMMVVGYGSQMAVADNRTAGGRTRNRRVEIYVMPAPKGFVRGTMRTASADGD